MLSLFRPDPLGWLPNPSDHRDRSIASLGLGSPSSSRAISVAGWCPPIYDQGGTNACVGYGMAAQIDMLHRQAFNAVSYPSALAIYTASRELHNVSGLKDQGTYPRLAAKALRSVGCPSEADWPSVSRSVNRPLPFRVAVQANGRRGAEYAFIRGSGDTRIEGIRQALAAGYPVGFGAKVSKSFLAKDGPHVVTTPHKGDPIVGGHYQVIVGVTENQNFRVRNSWGTKWRDSGYCWFTPSYITSALCSDFMIVYGWEAIRDARPYFDL